MPGGLMGADSASGTYHTMGSASSSASATNNVTQPGDAGVVEYALQGSTLTPTDVSIGLMAVQTAFWLVLLYVTVASE